MTTHTLHGIDGSDPLGFLAAVGTLRIVSRQHPDARLAWEATARTPSITLPVGVDLVTVLVDDLARWRTGHPALDAVAPDGDRKALDLKHPPAMYRALLREHVGDPETSAFLAAYATGVTVDNSGKTKPTALHFCAGQQRFLDAAQDLRAQVTADDLREALQGPWVGRVGVKDLRWRAGGERLRALLAFNPGNTPAPGIPGAAWLAYQALPLFPSAPRGLRRRVTTAVVGRRERERLVWPLWAPPLTVHGVRSALALADLEKLPATARTARGIAAVYASSVVRSTQGYGSFAPAAAV